MVATTLEKLPNPPTTKGVAYQLFKLFEAIRVSAMSIWNLLVPYTEVVVYVAVLYKAFIWPLF